MLQDKYNCLVFKSQAKLSPFGGVSLLSIFLLRSAKPIDSSLRRQGTIKGGW